MGTSENIYGNCIGNYLGTIWELFGNCKNTWDRRLGTLPAHSCAAPGAFGAPRASPDAPRRSRAPVAGGLRARAGAGDDDDCDDDREDACRPRASALAARHSPQELHSHQMCSTRALDGPSGHLPTRTRHRLHLPTRARLPPPRTAVTTPPTHPPKPARHAASRRITRARTRTHARAPPPQPPQPSRTHAPTTKPPRRHAMSRHITRAHARTYHHHARTHARAQTHARARARTHAATTTATPPPPPREHCTRLSCETRPLSEEESVEEEGGIRRRPP